ARPGEGVRDGPLTIYRMLASDLRSASRAVWLPQLQKSGTPPRAGNPSVLHGGTYRNRDCQRMVGADNCARTPYPGTFPTIAASTVTDGQENFSPAIISPGTVLLLNPALSWPSAGFSSSLPLHH
ncbi:hypothetical protein T310_0149, partial [Rasamsonia emersonii CBS 393.64]